MERASARVCAAAVALIAWVALGVQFAASFSRDGSVFSTTWSLLAYFTIITNLGVAILFTGVALRSRLFLSPWAVAACALSIALVGVVYAVLLAGLYKLTGADAFADFLLHRVTPVLGPAFWLVFTPKGRLSMRDPLLWAIYPLGYFAYALVRGGLTGFYPYPFMNVAKIGWPQTGVNAAAIAIGFMAAAWLMVALDRGFAHWGQVQGQTAEPRQG